MPDNVSPGVGPSRAGDQFHYAWAARRALKLLQPTTNSEVLFVEAVAPSDTQPNSGEEVIDVAEYYGGDDLKAASKVRYVQIKHSTVRADEEVAPSGLRRTISEFAKKYAAVTDDGDALVSKISFEFLTNRPIHAGIRTALAKVAGGGSWDIDANACKLRQYAECLSDQQARSFYSRLTLTGSHPDLWSEERELGWGLIRPKR